MSYATSPAPGIIPLRLWEYYATAESPLTSDNITVVLGVFPIPIGVFAIHTGDTKTIFDRNPSLPITLTCPGLTPGSYLWQDCSASVGRLEHEFVIAITAINDADRCPPSPGFSAISFDGKLEIDYRIVRASESDFAFTCAGGVFLDPRYGASEPMALLLDAISLHPGHQGNR